MIDLYLLIATFVSAGLFVLALGVVVYVLTRVMGRFD